MRWRRANHRQLLGRGDAVWVARPGLSAHPGGSSAAVAPSPQTDRGVGYPDWRRQTADTFARRPEQGPRKSAAASRQINDPRRAVVH